MGLLSWLNDLFGSHEEYGTPSVTLTGQPVRSKAERVIADYFTRHGIPYYYEAKATTNDWFIFKTKISRPDFFLPQYNLVVEYWDLVDSLDAGTRDTTSDQRAGRWRSIARTTSGSSRYIPRISPISIITSGENSEKLWASISQSARWPRHVQHAAAKY